MALEQVPGIKDYLPDPFGKEQRLPERDFFWKTMYALHPDKVDNFIRDVENARKPKDKNLQEQKWAMAIKDDYMNELLKFDFTSGKYIT